MTTETTAHGASQTKPPLLIAIVNLARARDEAQYAASLLKQAREQFEQTNATRIAAAQETADRAANAEKIVRVMAEEDYRSSQDKHPQPGVSIQIKKTLPVYSENYAFEWCKTHNVGLTWDKKVFEAIASTGEVMAVQPFDQPRATTATDLPAALEKAGIEWRA